MRYLLTIIIALQIQLFCIAGGGWTQPKKGYFTKLGHQVTIADKFFSPGGESTSITTFKLFNKLDLYFLSNFSFVRIRGSI